MKYSIYSILCTQLWTKILQDYPLPPFSKKSVYHLWSRINRKLWTRDDDPVISARKLLQECQTRTDSSEIKYSFEEIELVQQPGYIALAFTIPSILSQWASRIREISIDSACVYILFL